MTTDAKRAANKRYDKRCTRQVLLKLNTYTDEDILDWLDQQESKQGAIKALVRREPRIASAESLLLYLSELANEQMETGCRSTQQYNEGARDAFKRAAQIVHDLAL